MHRIEENLTAFLTVFFRGLFSLMGGLMILLLKIALTFCSIFLLVMLGAFYKREYDVDHVHDCQVGSDDDLFCNQHGELDQNSYYKW